MMHRLAILALVALAIAGCDRPSPSVPPASPAASAKPPPPRYAGSASCRPCHEADYEQWKASHHALAERPIDPDVDRIAFADREPIRHGTQISQPRIVGDTFEMVTLGASGQVQPFRCERVFGNKPLRQFLVPAAGGRYQVTELAYDPAKNEWFDVFGDEDRQPHEWGHWTNRGMTWNAMCADCHNTALRKNYDEATDSYATTKAEMGVGCEACHGPSQAHVDWQNKYADVETDERDPAIEEFRRLVERRPMMDACGACHSRRTELREEFDVGDPFGDSFLLAVPDMTETWYADGQVREENYVFASFLMSRMHTEGVRCSNCHDPHGLKTVATGNDLCLRCHVGKIDPAEHSHHDLNDTGGLCTSCHMPRTTYMQRHSRPDHGFTIPDPLLTKEFGVPNACNRCHAEETVEWAIERTEDWYGESMNRDTRERAMLIARARKREPDVERDLLAWVQREPKPLWRAIGASLLGEYIDQSPIRVVLMRLLNDESDIVRANAARSLAAPMADTVAALRKALDDPVRAVRISAAWSLGSSLDLTTPAAGELREYLEHNADQPAGVISLATFLRDHGRPNEAVERLRRTLKWQPDLDALHYALGMSLASMGQAGSARNELERACELGPEQPVWWYSLALARAETKDLPGSVAAFEKACELDPAFARAWYNLGLARNQLGDSTGAVDALSRAVIAAPSDVNIRFALATVLRDAGRIDDARQVAQQILQIDPSNASARALLASLKSSP